MEIFLQLIVLIVGFIMLIKGADWFVDGASGIAERFGIPQLVIGLTIVAMGTSAPEAAVSITSALKGSADITIGNVVGSNILNILVILGVTALIVDVAVQKSTIKYEIPFMIAITVVMGIVGMTGGEITLIEGILLWILFLAYLFYLFRMAKQDMSTVLNCAEAEEKRSNKTKSVPMLLLSTVVGCIFIILGSNFTVDSATTIARIFGISERFIGLTIVSLGTSLPELVTSVGAARKGKADIAIGNIVGSNVFNILFVIGTTALITPVAFTPGFIIDTGVAVAAGLLLLVSVLRTRSLRRPWGAAMLVGYAGYFAYIL